MLLTLLCALGVIAAAPHSHARVQLISEFDGYKSGTPLSLGLRFDMDPHWHIYWRNAGAAGFSPVLEKLLPASIKHDSLQWPHPDTIPLAPLMTYGYHDSVLIPFRAAALQTDLDTLRLKAFVSWQVCMDVCVLERDTVSLSLPRTDGPLVPTGHAGSFAKARFHLPLATGSWSPQAGVGDSILVLRIKANGQAVPTRVRWFPYTPGVLDDAAPQIFESGADEFRLTLRRDPFLLGRPDSLKGILVSEGWRGNASEPSLEIAAPLRSLQAQDTALWQAKTPVPLSHGSWWTAIVLAFLGGLLLNLMPCVLPVLSLKILDLLSWTGHNRRKAFGQGLVFSAGVISSFLALAITLLVLRASGSAVGWGFQLQSPVVVALLSAFLLSLALALWGVFEAGASLTTLQTPNAKGYLGSFFTGVTATVVATPCTAPFMGAALGYTLARPAWEALTVFASLGLGMSFPFLVLPLFPAALRWLPRPGAWMESLKQFMGFPVVATAAWLAWVLVRLRGADALIGLFVLWLFVALAAWTLGRWALPHKSKPTRQLARVLAVVLAASGVYLCLRLLPAQAPSQAQQGPEAGALAWEPFKPGILQELRAGKQPWMLWFTADWCLSCKVNERNAFEDPKVVAAFDNAKIRVVRADWTARDPEIAKALANLGRQGVPYYLLSDGRTEKALPEILTANTVLKALDSLR